MEKKPGKRGWRPLSGTLTAVCLPKVVAILITQWMRQQEYEKNTNPHKHKLMADGLKLGRKYHYFSQYMVSVT